MYLRRTVTAPRSILITGCSSGIGRHCARALKERGWRVFASARRWEDVERLRAEGLEALHLDLTDSASIMAAVEVVLGATGGTLDALFNNGAYGQPGAVEDLPRAVLREQFETNLFGTHELTCAVLPAMRRQGHGRIVHNSSVLGLVAMPFRGAYNASKFALEGLADTQRLELRGTGIHISLIEPGPILSRFRVNALERFRANIDMEVSVHRDAYRRMLARLEREGAAVPFTRGPEAVERRLVHALESRRPRPPALQGMDEPPLHRLRTSGEGDGGPLPLQPREHTAVGVAVDTDLHVDVGAEPLQCVDAEAGEDGPRLDEADVDPGAAQLQPLGVGEPLQGELAGVVGAAEGHGDQAEHRTVVDDAPMALAAHGGEHRAGEFVGAEEVGLELFAQHRAGEILHRPGLAVGAVVEEGVQSAAGRPQHHLHRRHDGGGIGEIQMQRFQPLGAQPFHVLPPPRRGEDPPATFLQRTGTVPADARGTASDQNGAGSGHGAPKVHERGGGSNRRAEGDLSVSALSRITLSPTPPRKGAYLVFTQLSTHIQPGRNRVPPTLRTGIPEENSYSRPRTIASRIERAPWQKAR